MIYLDNGATSFPKPRGMIEAMNLCMSNYCGNPGRSGHDFSQRTGEQIYLARKNLAGFFKIKNPERMIFTGNATQALNLGIKGILSSGDHVITTMMEHNSVLRPIWALQEQGVEHTLIQCKEDGSLNVEDVREAIQENTKLVICTQASNVTGTIMPIEPLGRLCREKGILFMVDGAQGAGHLPIDIDHIDMLAVPGHKGLLGPLGTGFLYLREGLSLKPLIEGGTGTASKELVQPCELPEGYEAGTVNAPGIIGLGYSADFVNKIGIDVIRKHQLDLTECLDGKLRNMNRVTLYGPEDCNKKVGIVTFNIEGYSCEETASLLNDEYEIAVRGGYHCAGLAHRTIGTWDCGAVRMSMGIYNTERQMEATADAVYKISKG